MENEVKNTVENEVEAPAQQEVSTNDKVEVKDEQQENFRIKQALDLLSALENPEVAPTIVKTLAEQYGLLENKASKQDLKDAVDDIRSIVKKHLGETGSFIADELAGALEEVFNRQKAEFQKQLVEIEARRAAAEFQREYAKAIEELEITEAEADALIKLVDEYPWNGRTSVKNYLSGLLKIHRSGKEDKRVENIKRSAKTVSAPADENRVEKTPKKFSSPHEAVEFALRQLNKG